MLYVTPSTDQWVQRCPDALRSNLRVGAGQRGEHSKEQVESSALLSPSIQACLGDTASATPGLPGKVRLAIKRAVNSLLVKGLAFHL